jgi:hypothetical protein
MRELHRAPATKEDLKAIPEGWVGQIIDGELWALPRPAFGHGRVTSELGFELIGPFGRGRGGPGGWLILDEPITARTLVASAVIVTAVVLITLEQHKVSPARECR